MNSSVAFWPSAAFADVARGLDDHPVLRGQRAAGLQLRHAPRPRRGTCGRRRPAGRAAARSRRRGSRSRPPAAVSTRPVPFGTSTSRSSIVTRDELGIAHACASATRGACACIVDRREDALERRVAGERAAACVDVRLELVAELVDVARDGDRVGVAERAEALADDAVADVEQQVEVGLRRAAVLDLLEDLRHPARARRGTACTSRTTRARRTATTRIAELHHAAAVVDHDHAPPSRSSEPACDERVEVERRVDLVGRQHRTSTSRRG